MKQYGNFAYIYDELMDDVDYEAWVYYIEKLIEINDIKVKNILELACGTGNLTIPLTKRGYDICGIDISEEMLEVALKKSEEENIKLVLLQQDIVDLDFDLYDLDMVLCGCDGFNYITSKKDLEKIFSKIFSLLKKDGGLIFDLSSYYKLKNILGNNFMGESREDLSYIWTNYFDDESRLLEMNLDFFVKIEVEEGEEDNLYEKYTEIHQQMAYEDEEVKKLLYDVGFSKVEVYGDFSFDKPKKDAERMFFVAKK